VTTPTILGQSISHSFTSKQPSEFVLKKLSFQIETGKLVGLTGASGSGKTTLLTLIGTLRTLQSGSLKVFGQELLGLKEKEKKTSDETSVLFFNTTTFLTA